MYANGDAGEEILRDQRTSGAHSVQNQQGVRSSARISANGAEKENVQASARSSVASPLLSPLATPLTMHAASELLTSLSARARTSTTDVTGSAPQADTLALPDSLPISSSPEPSMASANHIQSIQKPSTPLNGVERAASPTESISGPLDTNPHVTRTKTSVDFPSKLPSPARRRSVAVERKVSLNSTFSPGHRKIQSVSAATPPPPRLSRIDTGISASPISEGITDSPIPSRLPRLSIDIGTSTPVTTDTPVEETNGTSGSLEQNEPETSTVHVKIGAARHERKLLDLEISNSSLLAINRSLEREVLKQKSELRRLRRATRGGIANSRSSWLSEMSLVEDSSIDPGMCSPADSVNVDLSTPDEIDTPTKIYGQAAQPSMENRTILDLSKHKDLLIDSQKMNLSLQRCLGMTEQLLRDAAKALDYQPRATSKVATPADKEEGTQPLSALRTDDGYFPKDWAWTNASKRDGTIPRRYSDERETITTDKDSGVELDDDHHLKSGPEDIPKGAAST